MIIIYTYTTLICQIFKSLHQKLSLKMNELSRFREFKIMAEDAPLILIRQSANRHSSLVPWCEKVELDAQYADSPISSLYLVPSGVELFCHRSSTHGYPPHTEASVNVRIGCRKGAFYREKYHTYTYFHLHRGHRSQPLIHTK